MIPAADPEPKIRVLCVMMFTHVMVLPCVIVLTPVLWCQPTVGKQLHQLLLMIGLNSCQPECDIRMDFDTNEYPNIFV